MKIVIFLFNISCLKSCLSLPSNNDFEMIVDVIKSYDQPTSVLAKVCWNTSMKSKLAKLLAGERPITIQFLNDEDGNGFVFKMEHDNHVLFLVDVQCEGSIKFLRQASTNKMFNKVYRWLVLSKIDDLLYKIADLSILVDAEFIIADKENSNDINLQAVYKITTESEWIKEHFGTWTTTHGLNKSEDRMLSNVMRRKDLKGLPITASIVISDNNKTKEDYKELNDLLVDPGAKCTYRTNINLYQFLNATEKAIFSYTWGYLENGNWTGMVGHIDRGRAELCGCITFMTAVRIPIIEYIRMPGSIPTFKIVFRQPPLSYQYNLFVLPFTTSVWCCLGGLIVILIIILYVNAKWDIKKYEDYQEEDVDETCLRATWSDIVIFVVSAISQQGSANELKGTLGRIVIFIIFLAFVFFYTSYSASIVVLLQSTSDQIRTITDLMNSKLELGIEDAVYNRYYFSATYARDPIRKAFYETKIAPKGSKPNFVSLEEGIKNVQTKPFAFNMNTGSGYRLVSQTFQEHEKCGLQEIDYVQTSKPWLCSKKHSPYAEMYRVGFYRIEEHGLSHRNNLFIFEKKPICSVSGGNFGSVNMVDFYPVLLLLLYGMILAFVFLALEILVDRRQKIKRRLFRVRIRDGSEIQ